MFLREIVLMSDWELKIQVMVEFIIKDDVYIIVGVLSWIFVLVNWVLEIIGVKYLCEVWFNLELFLYGGVSFEFYCDVFCKFIFFDDMYYVEIYNVLEGFFGIQDDLVILDMLFMFDYGIFYEFILMDSFNGFEFLNVIDILQVKLGVNYVLVIFIIGGLWCYIVGDIV